MSDTSPVHLSGGLPSTVLPDPGPELRQALAQAIASDEPRRAIADIVAANPRLVEGWAALGDHGRDDIERYAYYRIGYHRGLDALRANGWRGSGYVRWGPVGNRGFLRSLLGLAVMAGAIDERDEADRCHQFLLQLDPTGIPADEAARFGSS